MVAVVPVMSLLRWLINCLFWGSAASVSAGRAAGLDDSASDSGAVECVHDHGAAHNIVVAIELDSWVP